jgi:hypothetical protein
VQAFTYIVSLGYRCRTTRRLRDHYGFDTAFPFDWWVTSLEGAISFLRDWDLERLYDPARLRDVRRWGRSMYVEHTDYRIRLQHEFPMDEARQRVLPGWRAHVAEARARTAHLMRKFDALDRADRQVLFVRELRAGEEAQTELIAQLREAVLAHVPRAQSRFLLISRQGVAAEGWTPLAIDDPMTEPWTGTPQIWDAALQSLEFRLERQQSASFETAARAASSG